MPMKAQNTTGKSFLRMNSDKWEYYSPDDLIKKTIVDILRSFETIPTGSIHWCPVTIEQYKTLCEKQSKQYTHNITDSDPLVRDFLVCDGRKYMCADFPELAKILNGEKVSCHIDGTEKDEKGNKISDEFYYPSSRDSYKSEGEGENQKHYFHVPDLRHMFISSVIAKGIHGTSDNAGSGDILSPDSGNYTPDCNAEGITIDKNQHRHFTSYGTWQVRGYSDYIKNDKSPYHDIYPNTRIHYDGETFSSTFDYSPTTPVIDPSLYYDSEQGKISSIKPLTNN